MKHLAPHVVQKQEDATAAQLEWVKSMRRQFGPADMLNPGGDINQDFFKPEKVRGGLVVSLAIAQDNVTAEGCFIADCGP